MAWTLLSAVFLVLLAKRLFQWKAGTVDRLAAIINGTSMLWLWSMLWSVSPLFMCATTVLALSISVLITAHWPAQKKGQG